MKWFKHGFWHELLTGQSQCWHRCGVCKKWMSDLTGGFFQDYICPLKHYEFHFDSGHFKCRVGQEWIEFGDNINSSTEKEDGLTYIKMRCKNFNLLK